MCTEKQVSEMAGLNDGHRDVLVRLVSQKRQGLVHALYGALTRSLNPHLPVLTALVAMVNSLRQKDFGVLGDYRLVRLPLSIVGSDRVRYRTQIVNWLHESVLSLRMSDLTISHVRGALQNHGMDVCFLCSCGVVVGMKEDVAAFYGSQLHVRIDKLRSAIDAQGNPVRTVRDFHAIDVPTMDLHSNGAEVRLFEQILTLTEKAATCGMTLYPALGDELSAFVARAQQAAYEVAA